MGWLVSKSREFRSDILTIIREIHSRRNSLSQNDIQSFLRFMEWADTKLAKLESEESSEIPDTARLLWEASGANPQIFVQFLGQYPDAQMNALRNQPQALMKMIEQLSQSNPKGQQQTSSEGAVSSDIPSSNVWGFNYDPRSKRLLVKFNGKTERAGGPTYAYEGVPPLIANMFMHGMASAKTDGSNRWGRWWKSKMPSMGSAMNQLIKASGFPYMRIA
jgi:hypothetical protein